MLFLDVNKNEFNNAEKLQEMLDKKKNIFILVYMIGCMPCKNTLPEWNKLKGCQELKQYENNDNIIIANVEQSMCEKMHHRDLENIESFPTIKNIQDNNVHDYNDERSKTAFSKWIKSLIKNDGKLKDLNTFVVKGQNKTNYGNIDMLLQPKSSKTHYVKLKSLTQSKRKKNKINKKLKSLKKITNKLKQKKQIKKRKQKSNKKNKLNKSKSASKSKSRRIFQKPLSYTKSLPI